MMATHPSEADIVGRTVRQAERLESIDNVEQLNILEVNYTVSSHAGVKGVELVLTVGGPDIRVNALRGTVDGSWGGDSHTTHFDSSVVKEYGKQLARLFEQEHDL
jgi:hypothetical protein